MYGGGVRAEKHLNLNSQISQLHTNTTPEEEIPSWQRRQGAFMTSLVSLPADANYDVRARAEGEKSELDPELSGG